MDRDRLSMVFAALADPTRRDMLARLSTAEATVSELAKPYPISLPAVSRHLKVLEQAGLISRTHKAQWRTNALRAQPALIRSMSRSNSSATRSDSRAGPPPDDHPPGTRRLGRQAPKFGESRAELCPPRERDAHEFHR